MTDVAKHFLLIAYLFLLRVLMLYPVNFAGLRYSDFLNLHLLCVKPDIDLQLAVDVLLSEPSKCLFYFLLWLHLEHIGCLATTPPLTLVKIEFEENLALDQVIILTEVTLTLNTLLLLLLRLLSHLSFLLLLLLNEGGGVHHWNLGSGIGVERWLL